MSLIQQARIAAQWSDAMTNVAKRAANPETVENPALLAQFNVEMYNASTAYQLTVRTIQDLHREDQLLSELLRDA